MRSHAMDHDSANTGTVTGIASEAMKVLARSTQPLRRSTLVPHPRLDALRRLGTRKIYADTADVEELNTLITHDERSIYAEVDGNTANQPLVHKVIQDYLAQFDPGAFVEQFVFPRERRPTLEQATLCYAVICAKIGNDFAHLFAGGRSWEVSLQLHMGLTKCPDLAKDVARWIRLMAPSAIIKVPFAPYAPECFIVARDLEHEGIPVNFTSTFSARQVVAAALLCNVTRTNIFLGRLDQGLEADLLGAHVSLEAQRALRRLRQAGGVKTQLIVASLRNWETFLHTAGCDVYTAPVKVLRDWMKQERIDQEQVMARLDHSYDDRLGISARVLSLLGAERIAKLYDVERSFIDFLKAFGATQEWREMTDPEALFKRFEEAGFSDIFYSPRQDDWMEIRRGKIPDPNGSLIQQLPLDTLYSLLADANFEKHQDEMDDHIARHLSQ
jgi:transaldolase